MTWSEIKKFVEEAGIKDSDEISVIQCDNEYGDQTFHVMRLGQCVKLTEQQSDHRELYSGCAT